MTIDSRVLFRIFLCVGFIVSLYGGVALLTAAMFVKGYMVVALVSGAVLTGMTAMALGLFGLAWSMTTDEHADDELGELPILTG